MAFRPKVRKLLLTAHVTSSVGWLGAVAGSLALSVAALASDDLETVRAAYLALELSGWYAVVPLSVASLVTGLVQSLGTTWGLFRHYWVVAKLVINVFSTLLLLMYMQTLGALADIARTPSGLRELRNPSPTLHAAAALVLLVVATTLSVYKPRGITPYGWRKAGRSAIPVPL